MIRKTNALAKEWVGWWVVVGLDMIKKRGGGDTSESLEGCFLAKSLDDRVDVIQHAHKEARQVRVICHIPSRLKEIPAN